MNEFETSVEFFGEVRHCVVTWEPCSGDIYLCEVEVVLLIESDWTPQGEYRRHIERRAMDVLSILSDDQVLVLTQQIRASCAKARAEDYHDSAMQDWEEKHRRLLAA